MSFARTKMKAVTSGAKTHPSVLRVIHALGRLEAGAPGNRDAPRRATSRPTSSGVRCSPSAAAPLPISSALVAVPPESPRRPADIYQLYGVRVPSADEVEVVSSESSSPPRKSARVAAGKVEDTKDSGFALQYYDKEKQVYITVKKDGASKEHPVSKGPNGFLTTKVYGRLKELDVPNLALGQSTSAAPTTSGSAKKKQPKKRPAAAQALQALLRHLRSTQLSLAGTTLSSWGPFPSLVPRSKPICSTKSTARSGWLRRAPKAKPPPSPSRIQKLTPLHRRWIEFYFHCKEFCFGFKTKQGSFGKHVCGACTCGHVPYPGASFRLM